MKARARRWLRRLLYLNLFLVMVSLVGIGVLYWLYDQNVVKNPGPHLAREDILRRIAMESPIFYSDGQHKLGVFFGAEHRQYVKFQDIPKDFVNAITSSEDARFFEHPGVDVKGITRAMIANIKARRVVAGGSTITQQTAKNLYYRNERTFKAKLEELLNALRLEALYSKEEIFEFYANQFHVHSNGRGLGIAARYFFDKDVKQLSLLESAFLAGVVKGPFRYNPFVGTTEEARAKARERARYRTWYVLDRMQVNGHLTLEEVAKLKAEELVFKEGDFRYDHNVILDYVFATLQEEPFTSLLEQHGIDNPATAGIQVTTTIDREWQQAAHYGLRHNLSDVGALLDGLTLDAFIGPAETLMPIQPEDIIPFGFLEGVVIGPVLEGKDAPGLDVDLGGVTGRVDKAGLGRLANLLKQAAGKNRWSEANRAEIRALAEQFPVGRKVYVSVKNIREDGMPELDLEANTQLQGAVVVLEQGRIRAMVGGQDNRNFNRATAARRQLGSTWKPLTFAAALSLGWSATSALDNRRQGFQYQGQWYWPRPDHEGIQPSVSLAFSGATSENLTAVSLLYHLTDLLSEDQMLDLADKVGLAALPDEMPEAYITRIRDTHGIVPTDSALEEGLFQAIKANYKVDLMFGGRAQEAAALTWLPFGNGFDGESARIQKDSRLAPAERLVRQKYLARGFKQLETLAPEALSAAELILRGLPSGLPAMPSSLAGAAPATTGNLTQTPTATSSAIQPAFGNEVSFAPLYTPSAAPPSEEVEAALKHFYLWQDGALPRLVYATHGDTRWRKATLEEVRYLLKTGGGLRLEARSDVAGVRPEGPSGMAGGTSATQGTSGPQGPNMDNSAPAPMAPMTASLSPENLILLEGEVTPATITQLRASLDERLLEASAWDRFSLKRLVHHPDFRVLVGLQYVIQLAQATGVRSPMRPVLSLTLGANEITLLEAAMIYQTLLEGKAYGVTEQKPGAAIIQSITTATGEVIYALEPKEQTVLEPAVGAGAGRILRAVVERGTAAKARRALRLASPEPEREKKLKRAGYIVPFMGKTGTTNDYLNVAFLGFLPRPPEGEPLLPFGQSLTIATYVGYDDNRPMKRGSIRIQGSSGALPAWLDTAQGILRDLNSAATLKLEGVKPGAELALKWPEGMTPVPVDARTGLRFGSGIPVPDAPTPEGTVLYEVAGQVEGETFREQERYLPFSPWGKPPEQAPAGKLAGLPPEAAAVGESSDVPPNPGENPQAPSISSGERDAGGAVPNGAPKEPGTQGANPSPAAGQSGDLSVPPVLRRRSVEKFTGGELPF